MAISSDELLKNLVDDEILAPDFVRSLKEKLAHVRQPNRVS